jgi:hypothetical protein
MAIAPVIGPVCHRQQQQQRRPAFRTMLPDTVGCFNAHANLYIKKATRKPWGAFVTFGIAQIPSLPKSGSQTLLLINGMRHRLR